MNRRILLATFFSIMLGLSPVRAAEMVEYEPGVIKNALDAGKTVFVDYSAVWCSTCARQERVVTQLRQENPAYDKAMVFVRVDWDLYGRAEVSTSRNIPRRSTLLVLKGDRELGRVVAGTAKQAIKALLDSGLNAGS